MQIEIESQWTHYNKKKITDKKREGKDGVEIDGVEYGLETETSDVSEDDATTLGDMSESESEIEVRWTNQITSRRGGLMISP